MPEAGVAHRIVGVARLLARASSSKRRDASGTGAGHIRTRARRDRRSASARTPASQRCYLALRLAGRWARSSGRGRSATGVGARGRNRVMRPSRARFYQGIALFEMMRGDPRARRAHRDDCSSTWPGSTNGPVSRVWRSLLEVGAARRGDAGGGLRGLRRGAGEHISARETSCSTTALQGRLAEPKHEAARRGRALATSTKRWRRVTGRESVGPKPNCIAFAAKSCSSATPPTPPPPKRPSAPPSPSRSSKGRAASNCAPRSSLAKLYRATGRDADAHAVLAPALEGFSPTPELPEIAEAQALFDALAESEDVRAELAQRRRMTQLQAAYGAALIAARGFGAPETTEAFARARESAAGDDSLRRLAADYGLWAGSYVRGDLPAMKAQAAAFLADVAAKPDSGEAGIAHRVQGMTHLFAGEFVEAARELELALARFEPGRDDDLAVRFPPDPGAAAMIYLAFASWALGEFGQAASLIGRMRTRVEGLSHATTLAHATALTAFFALMRGDRSQAGTSVSELAQIVRDHELPLFRAIGEFLVGWADAEGGSLAEGLAAMRRGVENLREQNAVVFDGIIKIALAEAEARAGDPERALAVLDEALATCERTSGRAFEAELHRARGDILPKCDPTNPAPAEDAFTTAIALAKRQEARGYALLASLSLAKLYQSTSRLAEAQAVLAPALEGFAPTPEMPEIAEAQALLVAIEAGAHVRLE